MQQEADALQAAEACKASRRGGAPKGANVGTCGHGAVLIDRHAVDDTALLLNHVGAELANWKFVIFMLSVRPPRNANCTTRQTCGSTDVAVFTVGDIEEALLSKSIRQGVAHQISGWSQQQDICALSLFAPLV
jgi:hypothetical protein